MAAGFGADPTVNSAGAVTVGTTASDIRKIFGALYSPGLISGGNVKASNSSMNYSVSEGVAAIRMAAGEVVLGYWPAVGTLTPPSTSVPRTDYIYAFQNTPQSDGTSNLRVEIGSSFPGPRAVLLGKFTYTSGANTSSDAIEGSSIDYSVPYGVSRGAIAVAQNTYNGTFAVRQTIITKSFYLPTDRQVRFDFETVLSTNDGARFSDSAYCEASYILRVDNVQLAYWRTPGLHQAWQTVMFSDRLNMAAGDHTVTLDRGREIGPGTPYQHFGSGSANGAYLTIMDDGVVK